MKFVKLQGRDQITIDYRVQRQNYVKVQGHQTIGCSQVYQFQKQVDLALNLYSIRSKNYKEKSL